MPRVLFQPAGSEETSPGEEASPRDRFESTIEHPVPLSRIREVLQQGQLERLQRISKDAVRIWGLKQGKLSEWQNLRAGDVVVFVGRGRAFASGVVADKFQNAELARLLWGEDKDGGTWEYIYVLENGLQSHEIPYSVLNPVAGYRPRHTYQGATLRGEPHSENVLRLIGRAHALATEEPPQAEAESEQENSSMPSEDSPGPPLWRPPDDRLNDGVEQIRKRLEIDPAVIWEVIAHLLAGRHVILVGPTGSGKTDLACQISEIFEIKPYVVTATADWTGYEVIGGPFPIVLEKHGSELQRFVIRPGCVYEAVRRNWESGKDGARGNWLVIDELNRAEVDKAFGELFTALDWGKLRVPKIVQDESEEATKLISLPMRFRIIGTMNSADRHYLFRLSDALKRRFAFVVLGLPRDTDAERAKVIERVKDNVESRRLPPPDRGEIESAATALYELLGFMRVFYPVGVAQAIATLEYTAVHATLPDASSPEQRLEAGLLANVVPQLESVPGRQLRLLRHCAMGVPAQMIQEFTTDMEAEPAGPFYDTAGLHDLREVARYLAQRCSGDVGERAAEIGALLELPHSAERQNELRAQLDGREGIPGGNRSFADLVAEEPFGLWSFPDVARRLDELAVDAGRPF